MHISTRVAKALRELYRGTKAKPNMGSLMFPIASLILGSLFLISGTLYCASLLVHLSHLRMGWDEVQALYEQGPVGVPGSFSRERTNEIVKVAVAVTMQISIYLADALLVRCICKLLENPIPRRADERLIICRSTDAT